MKLLSVIFLLLESVFMTYPNDSEIDFKPKSLGKEISKFSKCDDLIYREVVLPDSITRKNEINGKFLEVYCNNKKSAVVYIGRVNSCRAGGCSVQKTMDEADSEYFDYFVLYDTLNKVITVTVFNYAATHGQEITARGWLNQFTGFDGGKDLNVGKNIDVISGATISVHGIVNDVKEKTSLIRSLEN